MKIGDIVELIDEDTYGDMFRGRMTVINVSEEVNEFDEYVIECMHPDYTLSCLFLEEELVVMEESDD
jgi:hypothetical protein